MSRPGAWEVLRTGAIHGLLLWIVSRLSVGLHEVVGHALPGALLGLGVEGITVTWFGGGRVDFAGSIEGAGAFVVSMGGIFVNVLLCAGALGARPWRRTGVAGAALAILAAVNAVSATHYAALGSFYGFGDPARWPWIWPPALVVLVVAVPLGLAVWAQTASPPGRGLRALGVAAVALALYAGGFAAERALASEETQFRALEAEAVAVDRAVEQERARREQAWRDAHPGEEPPPEVVAVEEADVPRPFPLTATVIAFDALALLAVALRPSRSARSRSGGSGRETRT